MRWLQPAALLISVASLTACDPTSNHPDIFNVYAIATGKVSAQQAGQPVQDATVFFDVAGMGRDCQQQNLAKPEKYDSTTTGPDCAFTARLTFINMGGPVCVQAYVALPGATGVLSDTVRFSAGLKREAPFDTTHVTLLIPH